MQNPRKTKIQSPTFHNNCERFCKKLIPCLMFCKRSTQYTLYSNEGSNNMTLWYDGAPVLFVDNGFDGSATADITGKIYSKKKKEFKGVRSYKANEAVRCYRHTHNNVDIHNQYISYGHWDYKSRRKQMRVPYQLVTVGYHIYVR